MKYEETARSDVTKPFPFPLFKSNEIKRESGTKTTRMREDRSIEENHFPFLMQGKLNPSGSQDPRNFDVPFSYLLCDQFLHLDLTLHFKLKALKRTDNYDFG